MRALPIFALLSIVNAASAAAQGMVVPVHCAAACNPVNGRASDRIVIDSVAAWANVAGGTATTYVNHVIRNQTPADIEGAFFFPLPRGATVERVMVYDAGARLELYNEWSSPAKSRRMLGAILRERPGSQVRAYAGRNVVHVRIPSIPAGQTRRLQIAYRQSLRRGRGGALTYRYPLGEATATAPAGELSLGVTVTTRSGFVDLRSPSHALNVTWGTELGPCPPQSRCGSTSVPSRRVKVVRMEATANARTHDFVLVYTPAATVGQDAEPLP